SDWLSRFNQSEYLWRSKIIFEITCGVLGVISLIIALGFTTHYRPSIRAGGGRGPNEIRFLCTTMAFSLLSAALLTQFLASDFVGLLLLDCGDSERTAFWYLSLCDADDLVKVGPPPADLDNDFRFLRPLGHFYVYPLIGAIGGAVIYAIGYAVGWF